MAVKTGSNQKKRVNKGDDEYLETFRYKKDNGLLEMVMVGNDKMYFGTFRYQQPPTPPTMLQPPLQHNYQKMIHQKNQLNQSQEPSKNVRKYHEPPPASKEPSKKK
eukprot:99664_1